MKKTSGTATEEGSVSQHGQTCNRCGMYRTTKSQNIHISLNKFAILVDYI